MSIYLFQAIVIIFIYFQIAVTYVLTMLPINFESFIYLDNITSIDEFYKSEVLKQLKMTHPEKTYFIATTIKLEGSDEFFTDLAYHECNRNGLNFDQVGSKKLELAKRFNHPMVMISHPELDSFTLHTLTHAKQIKGAEEIQTVVLAETDLEDKKRAQYVVATEFMQIPGSILKEYIANDELTIHFKIDNVDALNFARKHETNKVYLDIAKETAKKLELSRKYLHAGLFDTNSPLLGEGRLQLSKLEDKELITIYYKETKESFILSKSLKTKVEITEKIAKNSRRCIVF